MRVSRTRKIGPGPMKPEPESEEAPLISRDDEGAPPGMGAQPQTEEEIEMAARIARIAARAEAKAKSAKSEPASAAELVQKKAAEERLSQE